MFSKHSHFSINPFLWWILVKMVIIQNSLKDTVKCWKLNNTLAKILLPINREAQWKCYNYSGVGNILSLIFSSSSFLQIVKYLVFLFWDALLLTYLAQKVIFKIISKFPKLMFCVVSTCQLWYSYKIIHFLIIFTLKVVCMLLLTLAVFQPQHLPFHKGFAMNLKKKKCLHLILQ